MSQCYYLLKLGVGDLHNREYNDIVITSTMSELNSFAADSRYMGFPIDDKACMYTFRVYPSDELKAGKKMITRI
jgi:hypothetical protein